jgi:hypothetical protein
MATELIARTVTTMGAPHEHGRRIAIAQIIAFAIVVRGWAVARSQLLRANRDLADAERRCSELMEAATQLTASVRNIIGGPLSELELRRTLDRIAARERP